MKKGFTLLMVFALLAVYSSVMAAAITWSVIASPANSASISVTADGQPVANPAKFVVQPGTSINIPDVTTAAGYYFYNAKKDGKAVDESNLPFIADTKSHKVIIYFKKDPVITSTASPKAGGTIAPSGKVSVEYESNQEFIVQPNTGYEVKSLKVNGKLASLTNNTYTFTNVIKANTITATFAIKSYAVTSSVSGGHGKISPSGTKKVNHGKSLVYTAIPDKGYKAVIYLDGTAVLTGLDSKSLKYTLSNITSSLVVEGKFVLASTVFVTDITLNKTTLSLNTGDSETLTPTINPSNATNKTAAWSSNDTAVATVDSDGKVTAVGDGSCTITASTLDGGFKAECVVTVNSLLNLAEYNPAITIGDKSYMVCTEKWTGSTYIQTALSQESIDGQPAMKIEQRWGENEAEYKYLWNDANHFLLYGFVNKDSTTKLSPSLETPAVMFIGQEITSIGSLIVNDQNQGSYTVKQTLKQKGAVTVPAGTFDDCILLTQEITIPGEATFTDQKWFAKGIGEIKIINGDGSVYELTCAIVGGQTHGTIAQFDIADYLPQQVGNTWTYNVSDMSGYLYSQMDSIGTTTTFHGNTVTPLNRTSINNTDTEYRLLDSTGYYAYGNSDPDDVEIYFNPPIRIFPKNVVIGETYTSSSNGMTLTSKISGKETVNTSAGTFDNVLRVVISVNSPNDTTEEVILWLAPNIGSVKEIQTKNGIQKFKELKYANINSQNYGNVGPINLIEYNPVITIGDKSYWASTNLWNGVYTQTALSQESFDSQPVMKMEQSWGNSEVEFKYLWIDANHFLLFGFDNKDGITRLNPPLETPGVMSLGQEITSTGSLIVNNQNQGNYMVKQTLKQRGALTVPAGTFDDCILLEQEITVTGQAMFKEQIWYAKGIGQIHITNGDGSSFELTCAVVGGKVYGTIPLPPTP